VSDPQPRRGPIAPDGFLLLADTAGRFADRLRRSRQYAEHRVRREIDEGKLRLIAIATTELLATTAGARLDFGASEAFLDPAEGEPQVIHLHNTEGGHHLTMHTPPPRGVPVVLDADDVERLLDELAPRPASTAPTVPAQPYPAPSSQPPATSAPRLPGRPAEYDWPSYLLQVRRRVYRHGLPENSSIIVAEVLALFGRKVRDKQPEQRTVERKLADWWPDLVKLDANLKELRGPCEITPISNSRLI
jgi:hypothetical protein